MLPLRSGSALLLGLTRGGATVAFSVSTIKGVDYAFFAADSGSYVATYGVDIDRAGRRVARRPAPAPPASTSALPSPRASARRCIGVDVNAIDVRAARRGQRAR